MRLGLFDAHLDLSIGVLVSNLTRELRRLGVDIVAFGPRDSPPGDVDLLWDPRLTGGTPPWHRLREAAAPIVGSLQGVAPLGIPPWEYYADLDSFLAGYRGIVKRIYAWHRTWKHRCAALITNSLFSQREIESRLRLADVPVIPIHLGVDHARFRPVPTREPRLPYLLHVSQYQPKKNLPRIFAAYSGLPAAGRPRLVAVLSRYSGPAPGDGIEIVDGPVEEAALVELYQGALAFVFPSLHEGFGLPILEAMACGSPVVTSDRTGCAEVAGDAAILVDPRSVAALRDAMRRLLEHPEERREWSERGLRRARRFSWERCARSHLRVFEWVADGCRGPRPASGEASPTT